MAVKTLATISAAFAARYPAAQSGDQPGTIDSISASGGSVATIEAAAVKGFASVSGKLQWVKATDHFYVSGELVQAGDFVQVEEMDAKRLTNAGRADLATDEQVKAAQSVSVSASKGKA